MNTKLVTGVVFAIGVLLLLANCERGVTIHKDRLNVLGTFAQVSIAGMTPEAASAAIQFAENDLKALDAIGYTFESDTELQRLNEAIARGRTVDVSPAMLDLLTQARRLSAQSGGLFNPAAGELTALWEFHCDSEDCNETAYPDEVRRLVEEQQAKIMSHYPTMGDLMVHGNRVSSRNRQVRLEFGDIIRGLALDQGISHLQQAGVSNAMIDIGGSVHTIGSRGDHAWWVGIPDASGKHSIGSIDTDENESVFTVRALDRSYGKQDIVYRHVVDPRTGKPVENLKSVTVIHASAMTANAAATALLVAGIENWKAVADGMGVHQILMIAADDTIYTSPAIDHRIHWKQGISHKHLVP